MEPAHGGDSADQNANQHQEEAEFIAPHHIAQQPAGGVALLCRHTVRLLTHSPNLPSSGTDKSPGKCPQLSRSWLWVPMAAMVPPSITRIRSASSIEEIRWAMIKLGGVRNLLPEGAADHGVGLGIHRRGGVVQNENLGVLESRARGNAQPLFLPAGGHWSPPAQCRWSYLSGKLLNKGIGPGPAYKRAPSPRRWRPPCPSAGFSLMVPEKRTFFCNTMATCSRKASHVIVPHVHAAPPAHGLRWRHTGRGMSCTRVLLEVPVPPRMPNRPART